MADYTLSLLNKLKCDFVVDQNATKKEYAVIRTDHQNADDVHLFVSQIISGTSTNFRTITRKKTFARIQFSKKWLCKRAPFRKKPGSTLNAGCNSFIKVVIKKITPNTVKSDTYLKMQPPLPCIIMINLHHTHSIESADALRRLDVAPEIKEQFHEYFKDGLSIPEARRLHGDKLIAQYGCHTILSNSAVYPTDNQVYYIYKKWRIETFGPFDRSQEKLSDYESEGESACWRDIDNPDWVPLKKLGKKTTEVSVDKIQGKEDSTIQRYEDNIVHNHEDNIIQRHEDSIMQRHEKMFPVGTKIISCKFSSEKIYTAELRLKCKSKEEFKVWLTDFENRSGNIYYEAKTMPIEGKTVLYKAMYRCQQNTHPFSHRVVKSPSKKHTDCPATFNVIIKDGRRKRTRDILVAVYPTTLRIHHNHNHDIDVAEEVEYRGLEENVNPSWYSSLLLEYPQVKLQTDNENDFDEMESDADVSGDLPDSDDEEPEWEEVELIMKDITATFKEKFKECPKDCANSLKSMHKRIQTMETADLLSVMQDFGKVQYRTITGKNLTSIAVKETLVSQKESNISTTPYVLTLRPVKEDFVMET